MRIAMPKTDGRSSFVSRLPRERYFARYHPSRLGVQASLFRTIGFHERRVAPELLVKFRNITEIDVFVLHGPNLLWRERSIVFGHCMPAFPFAPVRRRPNRSPPKTHFRLFVEYLVRGDQSHVLQDGLSKQDSIPWIAMVPVQVRCVQQVPRRKSHFAET